MRQGGGQVVYQAIYLAPDHRSHGWAGASIGHMLHPHPGQLIDQFPGQMGGGAIAGGSEIALTGFGLGIAPKGAQIAPRHAARIGDPNIGHRHHQGHGAEIRLRIIGKVAEQRRANSVGGDLAQEQRVIIGFAGEAPGGERAARTWLVFDHNIAPEPFAHGGGHKPRDHIRGAARREGADQAQILVWPSGLSVQRGGSEQPGSGGDGGAACDECHEV